MILNLCNIWGAIMKNEKSAFFAVVSALAQYIERADTLPDKYNKDSAVITRKDDEEHGS